MKESRFSDDEILRILAEAKAGDAALVCRSHGVAERTFLRWQAKFDGLDGIEVKRMRDLEAENRKLKLQLANAILELSAMQRRSCPWP